MSSAITPPDSQPDNEGDNEDLSLPPELIDYIPEDRRGDFSRDFVLHIEQYSGIVPHPSIVRQWEQIMPGSADRVLTMSEEHHSGRIEMEKTMVKHLVNRERLGMYLYFVIAMTMIIGGIIISLQGFSTVGLVALGAPIATLAGAFIFNRSQGRQDGD